MTEATVQSAQPPAAKLPKAFAPLVGVTSLLVLVQAVIAGEFIDFRAGNHVIDAHAGVAYLLCLVTAGLAAIALATMRDSAPELAYGSAALFILTVAQTVTGSLITKGGHRGLITVHVPLAFIIFGVTIWLAVRGAVANRG